MNFRILNEQETQSDVYIQKFSFNVHIMKVGTILLQNLFSDTKMSHED